MIPSDPHPIIFFDAIGGAGKSMLTWHWLNHHAPKLRPDLAGLLWYSFYERGAQMSDFCRHALAAYRWYWADGEPYVFRYYLNKSRALLEKLNAPIPNLPPYDPSKREPFPWEPAIAKLRAARSEPRP